MEINQERALAGGITSGDPPGFPVFLTQPGSYVLTGNLSVSDPNGYAIAIFPMDPNDPKFSVTVDLNGFEVAGPVTCSSHGTDLECLPAGNGYGIVGAEGNTVRNGRVRGFAGGGIDLGVNSVVEGIHAEYNGGNGIFVGNSSLVSGNIAYRNAGDGIRGYESVVVNNTSDGNKGNGIRLGGVVQGNICVRNGGVGLIVPVGGYLSNVLNLNAGGAFLGPGLPLGPNVCDDSPCP